MGRKDMAAKAFVATASPPLLLVTFKPLSFVSKRDKITNVMLLYATHAVNGETPSLLRTQDDDGEMLRRAREDPLFRDAPSVLYRAFNQLTGAGLTVPRQKEHNDMCLAIEKMKEKGRREGRKDEHEKSLKALEEERDKSAKALEEERKNGICNLIATCRRFGVSLEMACRQLMECYHLTQSEASAYLKEYYV